jgi:hypothetical protein
MVMDKLRLLARPYLGVSVEITSTLEPTQKVDHFMSQATD